MILAIFRAVVAHYLGPYCAYPDLAHRSVMQCIEEERNR